MARKPTGAKGEKNSRAKLTDRKVRAIRYYAEQKGLSQREIARRMGVTQPNIHYILTRQSWRHVW